MNILVLDLETMFSADYTLKKLSTEAYIRDPRFEALLLGVYEPRTGRRAWVPREEIPTFLAAVPWASTAVLCHHAQFDGLILSHHYGVRPACWLDTLSMARLMLGNHVSIGLASLAKHYGLDEKSVPYDAFKGRSWAHIPPSLRAELGEGAIHDCELTWDVFNRLKVGFPVEEYGVTDLTIRMFTEPRLVGDLSTFRRIEMEEWTSKNDLLLSLGCTSKDLQSADKFVALLELEGVEVEYKEGKNGKIPAIAATDDFMRNLAEAIDARVATLATARLEVKSTIDETRAGRLAGMASRGQMPVYLKCCGAQTLRWAAGDATNFQNMRRGSALRKGLSAPDGHLLAVIDQSQVEARLLDYVAGQEDKVEAWRRGEDQYLPLASRFYGETILKEDKARRGLGKLMKLSCGYRSGGPTIVKTAAKGTYGPPVILTQEEGLRARDEYRAEHLAISGPNGYWRQADQVLEHMARGCTPYAWRGVIVGPGYLEMPNGARMLYNLKWDAFEEGDRSWFRKTRNGWKRTHGGVLAQNIMEAFGRLLVSQAMLRIRQETGLLPVLTTHDEVVYCVPEAHPLQMDAELQFLEAEMTRVPDYLPGIPLACEGHLTKTYDK